MKLTTTSLALIALPLSLACASEEPGVPKPDRLPPTGEQFVISRISLGESAADVHENGFDFDGDGRRENNLGTAIQFVFSALGRESQANLDAAVSSGAMMHLLMVGESSDGSLDVARMFLGADTDDDPTNNFDGDAELSIRLTSSLLGAIYGDANSLEFADGEVIVENTLFGAIELELIDARLRASRNADGTLTGVFGGAVSLDYLEGPLSNAIVSSILRDVETDCSGTVHPACCDVGSRGDDWMTYLDDNDDCQLEASEIETNNLYRALLSPDLDLDNDGDNDAASVGFGFEAVHATFHVPR